MPRPLLTTWIVAAGLAGAALLGGAGPLRAQQQGDANSGARPLPPDPYTGGDAAVLAKLGIERIGPFPWADHKTTTDIDQALGESRIIWIETAHLRIGCSLAPIALPQAQEQKRALLAELDALRAKHGAFPDKPRKLDPWLRAPLFAQRAEALYAQFLELVARTDADFPARGQQPGEGRFLGQPDKFLLLLFQKRSDLARYFERFCGHPQDGPMRHYHQITWQLVAAICCEGLENFDDAALHRYVVYMLMHNFVSGYRGFYYQVPMWLDEGIAHWYSRRIESDFVTYRQKPGEPVNREKQHLWAQKVRQRLEHEEMLIPFATVSSWAKWEDLGFQEHMQSWSRVDYLMSLGQDRVGTLLNELKGLAPRQGDQPTDKTAVDRRQEQLMKQLWQFDGPTFDRAWREWVLKTYPKK